MPITFVDVERDDLDKSASNDNLRVTRFASQAPTLNNTPVPSRNSSPSRKRSLQNGSISSTLPSRSSNKMHKPQSHKRTPTPCPSQHDIESLDNKLRRENISRYTLDELNEAWLGVVIVACFFTSGMIDAVAFNSWNCFVGMQTGNTIFAALGLGGLPEIAHELQYFKSLVAIGAFILGTVFFNFLHRLPTGLEAAPTSRRRLIFFTSFFIQTLFILVSAILVTTGVVSNRPFRVGQFSSGSWTTGEVDQDHRNFLDLAPIVFLAFQASGQVCLSRVLGLMELPTIVLSTLYHDYTADLWNVRRQWRDSSSLRDFLFVQSRRQNKRLFSIIALFVGGIVGGEMYKSKAQMAGALWFAVAIKATITLAFCFWKKQSEDDDSEK